MYISETSRHLSTRVREHLFTDKNSNIFKHFQGSVVCKEAFDDSCFKVFGSANTPYKLKIKESLHVLRERPDLQKQVQHFIFHKAFSSSYSPSLLFATLIPFSISIFN